MSNYFAEELARRSKYYAQLAAAEKIFQKSKTRGFSAEVSVFPEVTISEIKDAEIRVRIVSPEAKRLLLEAILAERQDLMQRLEIRQP